MRKENRDRMLFDAVSGIDPELIQEAAEPRVRVFPRYLWRMAACLVLVVGLILAFVGLPTQDEEKKNAFVVYVYANEGEKVVLNSDVNIVPNYSSYTEGHEPKPLHGFVFHIWLAEEFTYQYMEKSHANLEIYCNEEKISVKSKEYSVAISIDPKTKKVVGYTFGGDFEEVSELWIVLRDTNGNVVQQMKLLVTPVEDGYDVQVLPTS